MIYVVPLKVDPILFVVGTHQSNELPALRLRDGLDLKSLTLACDSTCVPTTLNPAG